MPFSISYRSPLLRASVNLSDDMRDRAVVLGWEVAEEPHLFAHGDYPSDTRKRATWKPGGQLAAPMSEEFKGRCLFVAFSSEDNFELWLEVFERAIEVHCNGELVLSQPLLNKITS